ncbi:MAG: pseudouridine synthase [Clostridiaceae bacterium]
MAGMRLDRLLSNFGYGSRSEIRKLVKNGAIRVDGSIIKDASLHIDPESSKIEINGELLNYRKFIYVMMNKPAGVISATYDNKLKTAIDLLPDEFSCFDLFPAGRLDIDTEGMLLLTNDGQLAHELLSPKKHVPKRYYALIDGIVTDEDVKLFGEGVILDDGYKTMPAELEIIEKDAAAGLYEIELVLHEGKFHQVKRMFEATGKKVIYLKRIQMGGLKLDEALEPGGCRELTPEEVNLLKCRS